MSPAPSVVRSQNTQAGEPCLAVASCTPPISSIIRRGLSTIKAAFIVRDVQIEDVVPLAKVQVLERCARVACPSSDDLTMPRQGPGHSEVGQAIGIVRGRG